MTAQIGQKRKRTRRRVEPHKVLLIKQLLIGCGLALLVAGLLTGVWYATRLEIFTITYVQVAGGDTIDHEHVRQLVELALDDTYFHLVPKRFFLLYPEQAIIDAVSETERIATLTVERIDRTSILVTLTEHIPVALWCQVDGSACIFLNADGYAFASAPDLVGGSLVRIFDSVTEPAINRLVYDPDRFADLLTLVDELEETVGWGTQAVIREAEDRIIIRTTEGAELFVRLEQPISHTLHFLTSLLQTEAYEHLQDQTFAYIDLRFGNRLFVNESMVAGSATSSMAVDQGRPSTALDLSQPTILEPGSQVLPETTDLPATEADVTQTSVVESAPEDE